jgi:hypothetical protein
MNIGETKAMVTKEKLQKMNGRGEVHYTGYPYTGCIKHVGPRGGVRYDIVYARLNGKLKTWKRKPEKFYQLIKYGMYDYYFINEQNCMHFHAEDDCKPVVKISNTSVFRK